MEMIESCIPPGFRFHPTEEELVGYYLRRKINSLRIDLNIIFDIDLYNMEPWDIEERCKLLCSEEQKEWYFFSHKDKKYPTGSRTNRATVHGFWKATGRDKAVISKSGIIGMRKTLVFYRGRAPNGRKSDWIMHEYRIQATEYADQSQEEGWVVCRAFKKPIPSDRLGYEAWVNTHSQTLNPNQTRAQTIADCTIQKQDFSFLQNESFHHALSCNDRTMEADLPPLLESPCPNSLLPLQKSLGFITGEDLELDEEWRGLLMENNNGGSSLLSWT